MVFFFFREIEGECAGWASVSVCVGVCVCVVGFGRVWKFGSSFGVARSVSENFPGLGFGVRFRFGVGGVCGRSLRRLRGFQG